MFREKWKVLPDYKIGDRILPNKSRNVLIATTFRSGSTFLGDLLNHYPGTFYTYEPFWIGFLSQNVIYLQLSSIYVLTYSHNYLSRIGLN